MEDCDGRFGAIRGYFTDDSWHQLSDYEKQAFCNIKGNYDKMKELGEYGMSAAGRGIGPYVEVLTVIGGGTGTGGGGGSTVPPLKARFLH